MSTLHEQARAEAEKRYLVLEPARQARKPFIDGFLAGHEAASRPRQATTVAELDALPVGSVVLSDAGGIFERDDVDMLWIETGVDWRLRVEDIALPARVLFVPEEES